MPIPGCLDFKKYFCLPLTSSTQQLVFSMQLNTFDENLRKWQHWLLPETVWDEETEDAHFQYCAYETVVGSLEGASSCSVCWPRYNWWNSWSSNKIADYDLAKIKNILLFAGTVCLLLTQNNAFPNSVYLNTDI